MNKIEQIEAYVRGIEAGIDVRLETVAELLTEYAADLRARKAGVPDVEDMVNRFLGWRLPDDFAPDAGISFDPGPTQLLPHCWPTGTCLFTAAQAEQMIRHMLAASPKVLS